MYRTTHRLCSGVLSQYVCGCVGAIPTNRVGRYMYILEPCTYYVHVCVCVCVFLQHIGSGLSAMHVACIKGRADIVELLIARAEENLLNKSLKEILNARTKVSV